MMVYFFPFLILKWGTISKDELLSDFTLLLKDSLTATSIVDRVFNAIDMNQSGKLDFTGFIRNLINLFKNFYSPLQIRIAYSLKKKSKKHLIYLMPMATVKYLKKNSNKC